MRPRDDAALQELAIRISKHHNAALDAFAAGLDHALAAGRELIAAKERLPHGAFAAWVEDQTPLSARMAQNYMKLSRELPKLGPEDAKRVSVLPIRSALAALRTPRPKPWRPDFEGWPSLPACRESLAEMASREARNAATNRRIERNIRAMRNQFRIADAVLSPSLANLVAALGLIATAPAETIANAAELDPDINLEELAALLADAASRQDRAP